MDQEDKEQFSKEYNAIYKFRRCMEDGEWVESDLPYHDDILESFKGVMVKEKRSSYKTT